MGYDPAYRLTAWCVRDMHPPDAFTPGYDLAAQQGRIPPLIGCGCDLCESGWCCGWARYW